MKYIFLTGESVKSQIIDSISKNLTDSDLESIVKFAMYYSKFPIIFLKFGIFTEKILSDTFVPTFQNTLVKLFS